MKLFKIEIEECILCHKQLTRNDKQKGGCGFSNGKSFSYCVNCSGNMLGELLSGKRPKVISKINKALKSTQAKT